MSNEKHYPTHPGAEHPPIMTCEIPLEEYESLKRENERLNRELEHVKNGDCIYTCDVVEKHVKEELKAKRALWLARAYKAESEARGWYHSSDYIIKYDGLHNIKGVLYGKGFKRYPYKWMKLWIKIERLCLDKAEEYK